MSAHGRLLLVSFFLAGCDADEAVRPQFSVQVRELRSPSVVPYAPVDGGLEVPLRVEGGIAKLRGPAVMTVGLVNQVAADQTIKVAADADGGFQLDFSLVAAGPGEQLARAELGGELHFTEPFVVPSGAVKLRWLEETDAGVVGCLDHIGVVGQLEFRDSADASTPLTRREVGCDTPGESSSFVVRRSQLPLVIIDPVSVPTIQPVPITVAPSTPRELELVSPNLTELPDAGEPLLVVFRVTRGSAALPFVPYTLVWAPANDGTAHTLTGSTDSAGLGRALLVAPAVNRLETLLTSGSASASWTLTR